MALRRRRRTRGSRPENRPCQRRRRDAPVRARLKLSRAIHSADEDVQMPSPCLASSIASSRNSVASGLRQRCSNAIAWVSLLVSRRRFGRPVSASSRPIWTLKSARRRPPLDPDSTPRVPHLRKASKTAGDRDAARAGTPTAAAARGRQADGTSANSWATRRPRSRSTSTSTCWGDQCHSHAPADKHIPAEKPACGRQARRRVTSPRRIALDRC